MSGNFNLAELLKCFSVLWLDQFSNMDLSSGVLILYEHYSHQIERVQHKFLSFVSFKLNISHSYQSITHSPIALCELYLRSIVNRRLSHDLYIYFFKNLHSGRIKSHALLQFVINSIFLYTSIKYCMKH